MQFLKNYWSCLDIQIRMFSSITSKNESCLGKMKISELTSAQPQKV